ncbi:MAG: LysR family transcriptional regulator [Anaerotardibacter sp.]
MAFDNWNWFIRLAEKGNFTKAADVLQISQQTLSARLATLEKELDAKLIVRGTPLSLTPAGQAFLLYAREQQQAQFDLLRQIGEATGNGFGELKIGISTIRGRTLMPGIIKKVTSKLPKVRIMLHEGTNRELIRMAEHGEVDAVIARFGTNNPGAIVEPLYQEEVVCVIHEDLLCETLQLPLEQAKEVLQKEGLASLESCPFALGMVDDISGRIAYSELRNAGVKPYIITASESLTTLITMASQGLGATFAPLNIIERSYIPTDKLVQLRLSSQAKYSIELGTPMNAEPWIGMEVFREALLEEAKKQSSDYSTQRKI